MSLSKSAIIEKAKKLVLKGKIKQAIAEWKKLAAENPNDGNTYNAIGDLYLKSNDKPNATMAFIKAGDAFQSAAFELKSIALYKKALKVNPSKIEIHEKLAAVYAERGLIGNAIDDYLKVAKYYHKKKNFRAALTVYRKLSDLDPENVNIRLEIAEMCEKQNIEEEAVEEYKKVLALYDEKNMSAKATEIREKIKVLDPTYESQQPTEEQETSEPTSEKVPESGKSEAAPVNEGREVQPQAEEVSLQEESSQSFLAPEEEPLLKEQTVFPSEHTMPSDLSPGATPKEGSKQAQYENGLTEAEVYVQYGLIDKAIEELKSLVTSFPSELQAHLKLKEIYTRQGRTREAIATCHHLIKHYDLAGEKAAKYKILQDLKIFESKTEKAAEVSDTSPPAETKSNASYFDDEAVVQESTDSEAEPFGEATLRADAFADEASEVPTLSGLTEISDTGQNTSGGLSEDPLQALDPKPNPEEYVDLNSILSEGFGGDEGEIEDSLEKSFRTLQESHGGRDNKETETQYDLGIAYREMGMISEAMKAFELAASGQDRFEDATIMLAACYREEGSTPKATEILEKALAEGGNGSGSCISLKYELALLYEKLGNKQFKTLYQEVFEADPSFREIRMKYGDLTSKGQNRKKASAKKKIGVTE